MDDEVDFDQAAELQVRDINTHTIPCSYINHPRGHSVKISLGGRTRISRTRRY